MVVDAAQHKTIESVLQRGEKINDLVDRSQALSAQSKMFYKTAKKVRVLLYSAKGASSLFSFCGQQNSCCLIM
jgi:hypothetical protein